VRWILTLLLPAAACLAEEAKPPCNARNQGRLWPARAETDGAFARRAARCGELELCALAGWRYRWQRVTVHVSQLGKKRGAAGCGQAEAAPSTEGGDRAKRRERR
jgi:hypothetical protein